MKPQVPPGPVQVMPIAWAGHTQGSQLAAEQPFTGSAALTHTSLQFFQPDAHRHTCSAGSSTNPLAVSHTHSVPFCDTWNPPAVLQVMSQVPDTQTAAPFAGTLHGRSSHVYLHPCAMSSTASGWQVDVQACWPGGQSMHWPWQSEQASTQVLVAVQLASWPVHEPQEVTQVSSQMMASSQSERQLATQVPAQA